jgi:large subunit ribosomal protein L4
VFGPVPRSYTHKLPKKVRRAALRGALSLRLEEAAITVVDSLELGEFKTAKVAGILEGLGIGSSGILIVIDAADEHLEHSTRNLPKVKVLRTAGLNVFDVLRYPKLLLTKAAVAAIEARLGEGSKEASA